MSFICSQTIHAHNASYGLCHSSDAAVELTPKQIVIHALQEHILVLVRAQNRMMTSRQQHMAGIDYIGAIVPSHNPTNRCLLPLFAYYIIVIILSILLSRPHHKTENTCKGFKQRLENIVK